MSEQAINVAVETVRMSVMSTLVKAFRADSVSDVIGVHGSAMSARLGYDVAPHQAAAAQLLADGISDIDDEDLTEESLIAHIRSSKDEER